MVSFNQYLVVYTLLLFVSYSSAYDAQGSYCNPGSSISTTGPIASNIKHMLSDIISKIEGGTAFYLPTSGKGNNVVYGLAQCRGDVDQKSCLSCIHDATVEILNSCPGNSDARVWYDYCFLRYSQDKFYGKLDTSNGIVIANQEFVKNTDQFVKTLDNLFTKISVGASDLSAGGFNTGVKNLTKFDTLYGYVQCTGDLSLANCSKCFNTVVENFQGNICKGSKGCRAYFTSCYVRYELYPIFFPSGAENIPNETEKIHHPSVECRAEDEYLVLIRNKAQNCVSICS